jgi:hypothetical protein
MAAERELPRRARLHTADCMQFRIRNMQLVLHVGQLDVTREYKKKYYLFRVFYLHVSLAIYTARTIKITNIRLEKREQENILIYMELSRYKPWNKTGLLTDRTLSRKIPDVVDVSLLRWSKIYANHLAEKFRIQGINLVYT